MMRSIRSSWFPFFLGLVIIIMILKSVLSAPAGEIKNNTAVNNEWHAPDINLLPHTAEGEMIRYGRELINNTSKYFGPRGIIAALTNGMNCQNCHIEAGTRLYGNTFALVASTYPKYRERSGKIESVEFRINDCMERSMNGKGIDSAGREMSAMVAYIKWVGRDIKKDGVPAGSGPVEISFLQRAADPKAGKIIFESKCQRCHGIDGQGARRPDSSGYIYPPLWGVHSYNNAAGMYRISKLVAFIKYNMPYGPSQAAPQVSDDEAWDLAAFILSQPRQEKIFLEDWPKPGTKPVDYPIGPFTDGFSEQQHRFGPFGPIKDARERGMNNKGK